MSASDTPPDVRADRSLLGLEQALKQLAQRAAVLECRQSPRDPCLIRKEGAHGQLMPDRVARDVFERMRRAGLVEGDAGSGLFRLSVKGREAVRRLKSAAGAPQTSKNAARGSSLINEDESPLAWLRRRQEKGGAAYICSGQFAAGERLRADFHVAQMTPRVTQSWDAVPATKSGRRSAPGVGVEMADHVLAARIRVERALSAVGPELSGVLIDVCCHLNGLEKTERAAGWPQRSAKVILSLALTRLARHYRIPLENEYAAGSCDRAPAKIRHWGTDDSRPSIDAETGCDDCM